MSSPGHPHTGHPDSGTDAPRGAVSAATSPRATVVVTQRERFGMTEESLESLLEHTPDTPIVYVDGNSPDRVARYLRDAAQRHGITLIRTEHFLTPNQARNLGVAAAETEYVVFADNDVLYTPGWLERLIECADETGAWAVAPLTCQGIPAHSEIHHAGGDYAEGGDMAGFFANDPETGRAFNEVMHGHAEKVADWQDRLVRQETGMSEFHCVLAHRDVFDTIGPLDEEMLSTKEHIDFCMMIRQAGGAVWFEPASVVTYVFPCRARPMSPEDWPFFALRWSNAYGTRSLEHFIDKWHLSTDPSYVDSKKGIYAMRRMQGILIPLMRKMPVIGRNDRLAKSLARASMAPERMINAGYVALQDLRARRGSRSANDATRAAEGASPT